MFRGRPLSNRLSKARPAETKGLTSRPSAPICSQIAEQLVAANGGAGDSSALLPHLRKR